MRQTILTFLLLFFLSCFIQAQNIPDPNRIRMMSYNIQHGEGMDKQIDISRIAEVINKLQPDVVAIQEVDSVTARVGGRDILRELGESCLLHPYFLATIDFMGGKYGIGILSREKATGIRHLSLPGKQEARAMLIAEFSQYIFCCTHFSLSSEEREESVKIIKTALAGEHKPVFIAGDLNAAPDSQVMQLWGKEFKPLNDTKHPTYPADQPKRCIDYILGPANGQASYALIDQGVVQDPMASDHRPVYATVRLKTTRDLILRTKPYLQNPTGNGITVSWLTNVPVYSWVEYGTDTLNLRLAHTLVDGQVIANNYKHKIRLENLTPGSTYYYRIHSREILSYKAYSKVFGETATSGFHTFTLPEPGGSDFTAVIFNDIHKRHATLDALYEQIKDIPYDFVFFNGDCIDDPANEAEAVTSLSYYNEKVGAENIPVFYLRGNHEIRNAYSIELRQLFDYVGDKTYGAFSWGDTRFVMLDCGEDKPDSTWVYYGLNDFTQLRIDQVRFLKEETSSKAFKQAKKRILIHHIPVYGNDDKYNPCLELWDGILSKAPFHVALNGHTHKYAYHPAGSIGNPFPVVIGGGPSMTQATVMVLSKKKNRTTLSVLNTSGEKILEIEL